MKIVLYILAAVCAYLVAGINPAIVLSKLIYHKDIRTVGSCNPGFTNFNRCFSKTLSWLVLAFDLFKGAIVTFIFAWLFKKVGMNFQFGAAYTGFFALMGHAYPVWHGFKGGKGFLTYLSASYVIDWRAGLIATGIMIVLLFLTKYMSVATVVAMLSIPFVLIVLHASIPVTLFAAVSVVYIAVRHRKNFERLIVGTENKFTFKRSA